jgi:hypothetical protein
MTRQQIAILILGALMVLPILAAPVMRAAPPAVVPCDTDADCIAKNPAIPFGL